MLKLAFFLPKSSGYQDRIDMLKKLSYSDIDVTLIVGSLDRDISSTESENFRVVSVGFSPGNRIVNLLKTYLENNHVNLNLKFSYLFLYHFQKIK